MPDDPTQNFPSILQVLIYAGVLIASTIMALLGYRKKDREHEREGNGNARKIEELTSQIERLETAHAIGQLQVALEKVIQALRESFLIKFDELRDEVRELSNEIKLKFNVRLRELEDFRNRTENKRRPPPNE